MTVTVFTDEVDINPPMGVTPGLVVTQTLTGTASGEYGANAINIASDDVSGAATTCALKLRHNYGGLAVDNPRAVVQSVGVLTAPTSNTVTHANYIALLGASGLASGDGGALGSEKGIAIGVLGSGSASNSSAQNIFSVVGVQADVYAAAGSTVRTRIGVQAIDDQSVVQGSTYDSAFGVSALDSSVGWLHALLIGNQGDYTRGGTSPMHANATLIATEGSGTVKGGIDWSSYTFTQNEYNSANFNIDGNTGNVAVKLGSLSVGALSPSAGTQRSVQINGAASGTNAGAFLIGYGGPNPVWAIGNASSILGGAYDPTTFIYSPTAAYRFSGLTAGLLTSSSNGTVSVTATTGSGNVVLATAPTLHPGSSVMPTNNGDLVIEATSNTSLKFKYKGSDGVVRSATLTLS